jgi:sporulation protein YlmC with PRC-barrel domain
MSETLRVADLIGSTVKDASGATLGKVVDVVATGRASYAVLGLEVGASAWLDRLNVTTLTKRGRFPSSRQHIPWERVDRIDGFTIHLKPR